MNRERRIGLVLLGGAIFVILAVVAVVATREANALYYTVVFKNAEQLQAGDRVVINGMNIGVVKWLQLYERPTRIHVRLKIASQYASFVHLDSTAIIRGITFPNVAGQKVVEVVNADVDAPLPMPRNAIVDGMQNDISLGAWKLGHKFKGSGDKLKGFFNGMADQIKGLNDDLREFAGGPQARAALDELRGVIDLMQEKGRAGLAQIQEKWPQVKEKIGPVLRQMEETGRQHVADAIEQAMEWIERTLREWRKPAGAPEIEPAAPAANKVT